MSKTLPACRVVSTVPITASWYCLNRVSKRATRAVTGKPLRPWRVRISRMPPRWRWVYPSRFQFEMSSEGISRVTYCSAEVAFRAHWSRREDWIYSLGWGRLVEIRVRMLRVNEYTLFLILIHCFSQIGLTPLALP